MYVPSYHTHFMVKHTQPTIHIGWALDRTINDNNYLIEASSIERLLFSILAYYYLGYLISRDKTDTKQVNYYNYNVAYIVKLSIFLFHVCEAL